MRILVTGGAGFIGSHVVDKLRDRGHTPRILDMCVPSHHSASDVEAFLGDITDLDDVERALAGCDAVIHLAAVADVGMVDKDPAGAESINSRGTLNVLEAA